MMRWSAIGMLGTALAALAGCQGKPGETSATETGPIRARTLAEAVSTARAGDTIALPAGTFEAGLTLPAGVSLRGAGLGKTILNARKAEVGLTVEGGQGAEIADLTIAGAIQTDLLVKNATHLTLRRARTTNSLNGVIFADVVGGRVENVVSDNNRYGIVVRGGRDNVVVNCTVARNVSLGLSIPSGTRARAFNNCIADNMTGVYIGESAREMLLDHNLYHSLFTGKAGDQLSRKTLGDWQSVSGQDRHSVDLAVTFRDLRAGDYRPSGSIDWALDRAATTDWGTAALAGAKAPEQDADGSARVGRHDVGAFEVSPTPSRPADGALKIRSDAGLKSAGLFAPGGREVAYLFHNLPLPQGTYPFWFPARDFQGRRIDAGTYELKTVESALDWEYVNWIGDTGAAFPPSKTAAVNPFMVVFDGRGHLVMGTGWSEDATNLRSYDAATGRWLWSVPGSADMHGLALGDDGSVLMLRPSGTRGLLTRVDPQNGRLAPKAGETSAGLTFDSGANLVGLAALDGRVYVTDTTGNAVRFGPAAKPAFTQSFAVPQPSSPAGDSSTHVLWVISRGERLLALDHDGRALAEAAPVKAPAALAVNGGRLAVASRATGKVHVFDARNPKELKPVRTVGTGDGPFGPYQADRFHFQAAPGDSPGYVNLALGPEGELAVTEENRLLVFDPLGKSFWSTFGLFGNGTSSSFADRQRLFDTDDRKSIKLDESAGTWAPDIFWDTPGGGSFLGAFGDDGKVFGASVVTDLNNVIGSLRIVRYEGTTARPVLMLYRDSKLNQILARKDTNRDGRIDERDTASVMRPPTGASPIRGGLFHRSLSFLQPNGDVLVLNLLPESWMVTWRRRGLDAEGVPVYRLEDCREVARPTGGILSPYTFKPDETAGFAGATFDDGGGFLGLVNMRSAPGGTGLANNAGTDVVSLDARGGLRWFHSLARHKGLVGLSTVGPVTITGVATTGEIVALNRDGLGLGSFGFKPELHYNGFYLDHPQAVRAYRGQDGKTYALVADNYNGRHHWWRLHGEDRIVTTATPVTLAEPSARALAARPATPPGQTTVRPATPVVRVPRLNQPLTIDGSLEKWRQAGIVPQVILTPESASGTIDGPRDLSAVIRLAWRDKDLYLQFLTFDDVPTFHQPVERHHLQNGVELCINGFLAGFKFDVTRTIDAGPIVIRQRFYFQKLERLLSPEHCPRFIKVLDNARDVPERTLIESVYGVDMADCRVIVTELKLPIDEITYQDATKDLFPLRTGQTFRVGFLIDDNDAPGTDVQDFLVWPATYNNFGPVEDAAIAVLE